MSIKITTSQDVMAELTKSAETKSVAEDQTSTAETSQESDTEKNESEKAEAEVEAKAQDEQEAEAESEADADSDESKEDAEKPQKKSKFKRRVDGLKKAITDKERELEYWKQEALKRKEDAKPQAEAATKTDQDKKPKSEDFETHAEFLEALTEWKAEQLLNKRDAKLKQESVKSDIESKKARVGEEVRKLQATDEEFAEMLEDVGSIPMSVTVETMILNAEKPAELWRLLAKDRDAYERLNSLDALSAAKEIGKIEARLEQDSSSTKKAETKTTTKAPAPISPVQKSGAAVKKSIDDPNISFKDYEKLRMEQMRRKSA